jgi:hypothetical protein
VKRTTAGEPVQLARGKAFHKEVQRDWRLNAEGTITVERTVRKPSGRRGRIDVHADSPGLDSVVGVAEVKATDWDQMMEQAVRRNAQRYIRQIWAYIDSQIAEGRAVSPGVIFPARPKSRERLRMVEALFEAEGIPVVWWDESTAERKARAVEDDVMSDDASPSASRKDQA